jgi:hypothetical protein
MPMKYRVSQKKEERRVRMEITVLPSTKAKLKELQGDYSLSAVVENCLLDDFELINEIPASCQEVQGRGYSRLQRGHG